MVCLVDGTRWMDGVEGKKKRGFVFSEGGGGGLYSHRRVTICVEAVKGQDEWERDWRIWDEFGRD